MISDKTGIRLSKRNLVKRRAKYVSARYEIQRIETRLSSEPNRSNRTMNDTTGNTENIFGSYYALLVAFKTMKERCQQLQTRLAAVEEENMCLRLECGRDASTAIVKIDGNDDRSALHTLQVHKLCLSQLQTIPRESS